MKVIDDIKGLLGEFRSGLADLAQQDQVRIEEAQELRRTVARQAASLDEQREIISGLLIERKQVGDALGRDLSDPSSTACSLPEAAQAVALERDRLRAELDKVTAEAATMRAQLDHGARVLGDRIDWHRAQGGTLLAKTEDGRIVPAAGRIEMPVLDVHPSHLTDVLTAAEDDRREALAHVRTLLGILDATGGFLPPDYQAAIRAAREAVAG